MLNRLANSGGESRAISFQSIWGAGDSLAWQSNSGASVTADSSLTIAAFYGGVSLISNAISTLPMDCFYRKNGERVEVAMTCRLDTAEEVSIYEAGGVLQRFAQDFLESSRQA